MAYELIGCSAVRMPGVVRPVLTYKAFTPRGIHTPAGARLMMPVKTVQERRVERAATRLTKLLDVASEEDVTWAVGEVLGHRVVPAHKPSAP